MNATDTFKNAEDSSGGSNAESSLLQAMEKYQFRKENINQVQAILSQAKKEQLPTRPIRDKIYEGIAKSIAQDRIVVAAETVRSRYADAYHIARNLSDTTAVQNTLCDLVANTYSAGLKAKESERMVMALQTKTSTMNRTDADQLAIQVWATARTMAYRSVRSETIAEMTENAINCGYSAAEMLQVRNAFERQARYGSAENAARNISSDIANGKEAGVLGRSSGSGQGNSGGAGSGGSSNGSSGSDSSSGGAGSGGSGGGSGGSGNGNGGSGGSSGGSGGKR